MADSTTIQATAGGNGSLARAASTSRPSSAHPELTVDVAVASSGSFSQDQPGLGDEEAAVRSSSGHVLGAPLPSAGITAAAHVYAADVGVSLQNETVDAIHYDDATQLLMVVKGGVVFAYDLAMDAPGHHEQLVWTYPLQEGPRVTAMRCSLDQQLLGCLRGGMLLELVELTSGVTTVYKAERADLLGFFFTESPGADVVLVGRSGLELCEFAARRRGLRCRERIKVAVSWHLWTHETRCCLVATGQAGAQYLQAWQFVTSGTLSLPPFVVGAGPAAAAVAALGAGPAALPLPLLAPTMPGLLAGASPASPATATSITLSPRHVRLLKLYGRVYCAFVNTATCKLELYRFYTDTIALHHTYELFSTNVDLSVVDHVLILHHLDTAITVLIDVAAPAADMPVADPLPLAVLYPPPPPPRQPLPPAPLSPPPYQPAPQKPGTQPAPQAPPSPPPHQGPRLVRSSGSKELTHWEFIMPCTVIDRGQQAVYRLYLDLKATADSCSNPVLLASFLQRRRTPLLPQLAIAPKQLLLGLLRSCLEEQQPPIVLRRLFQHVCTAYAEVSAAIARMGGRASPAAAAAVLSLEELSVQVFQWYQVQMSEQQQQQQSQQGAAAVGGDLMGSEERVGAPDGRRMDALYLQAALSEFLSVAATTGLTPPAPMLSQQLQLALQQGLEHQADTMLRVMLPQYPQLHQLVVAATVGGPTGAPRRAGTAARAVVAALADPAGVPQPAGATGSAQAGSGPDLLVKHLLKAGNVLQAAKVARRSRATSVHPTEMLRVAAAQGDGVAFASVYRSFRDALMPLYPQLDAARAHLMPTT